MNRSASIVSWLLASAAGFVAASISHSISVLNRLQAIGIEITLDDRLRMMADDLLGLLPSYGVVIALALALAFFAASRLVKQWPRWRVGLYALAGFCGLLCALLAMQPILDITLIAGARGSAGLITQCLCGALAGAVYATLRAPRNLS